MYSVLKKFANCRIAAPTSPPTPTEVRTEDVDIQAEIQPVQKLQLFLIIPSRTVNCKTVNIQIKNLPSTSSTYLPKVTRP